MLLSSSLFDAGLMHEADELLVVIGQHSALQSLHPL